MIIQFSSRPLESRNAPSGKSSVAIHFSLQRCGGTADVTAAQEFRRHALLAMAGGIPQIPAAVLLLVTIGSYESPRHRVATLPAIYLVMDSVSQPFSRMASVAADTSALASRRRCFWRFLRRHWLGGCAAVLYVLSLHAGSGSQSVMRAAASSGRPGSGCVAPP